MQCSTPLLLKNKKTGSLISVPCRRCMACRINKRNYVSMLARFEVYSYYKKDMGSSFITLTYDDDYLPPNGSLSRHEAQNFLKRLREHLSRSNFPTRSFYLFGRERHVPDFKYFICGEYGDKDSRPHYHAIIFGVDSSILKPFLRKTWKKGFFQCSDVSNARVRYCMKYMDKQYNTNTAYWNKDDTIDLFEQPFSLMSHGIGLDFLYSIKKDIYENGGIPSNGSIVPLSPYYSKLLGVDSFNYLSVLRTHKRKAKDNGYDDVTEYLLDKKYSDELNLYHSQILSGSAAYSDYSLNAKLNRDSYISKKNNFVDEDIKQLVSEVLK